MSASHRADPLTQACACVEAVARLLGETADPRVQTKDRLVTTLTRFVVFAERGSASRTWQRSRRTSPGPSSLAGRRRPVQSAPFSVAVRRSFDASAVGKTGLVEHQARSIFGSAQDCSFSNWRLIKSSACSASLRASGLSLMAAPLFGTITRSNHAIRKRFTEM
jgi:hypothetical protein